MNEWDQLIAQQVEQAGVRSASGQHIDAPEDDWPLRVATQGWPPELADMARLVLAERDARRKAERALRELIHAVEQEWRARSPQSLAREEAAVIAARIVLEGSDD